MNFKKRVTLEHLTGDEACGHMIIDGIGDPAIREWMGNHSALISDMVLAIRKQRQKICYFMMEKHINWMT